MSDEDFDLEGLVETDCQFNRVMWNKKEMITRNDYLNETRRICNNYFNELKNDCFFIQQYNNHEDFELFLYNNSNHLDNLMNSVKLDSDFGDYLIGIDARIGIMMDTEDTFKSKFFKVSDDDNDVCYYTLPEILFEKYEEIFKSQDNDEKENEERMYL